MPMHPILRLPPVRPNTKYNHQGQHTSYRHKCTQFYLHPFIHPSQLDKNWNWKIGWITLLLFVWKPTDSRTVIQKYSTVTALSLPIWKSKKIWNIFKFVQFEWLLSVWPCENNFFWKTARNGLPLAIQRLRFPMAQLCFWERRRKRADCYHRPLDRSVQMASLGVLKKLPRISIDSTRGGYRTFFCNR